MKKLIIALFLCSAAFAPRASADSRDTAFLTKRFPAASVAKIDVATSGGSVEVSGDATREAIVEVFVSNNSLPKWTAEKIQSVLEEHYELDIKTENGVLTAHAHRKKGSKWSSNMGLSISFRITTPRTVDGEIKTSGGSIKAEDCSGTITLQTSGGSINLSDLSGAVTAHTSGGSVRAHEVAGTLHASTSGGNMILEDIAGNLEASTSGGNMKVDMRTVAKYVRLHNSGRIELAVPSGGYTLDLKGREVSAPELNGFSGSLRPNDITGTQYGGGPELTVKSSQRVLLSFK
ncbi:MAG: DUF4097 domain-containing protein [Prevotellaceae bacterium]|jgi:hypothetical protein|nr:DUF4097 domain-containing protein [Prevotellaceae bacterium]